MDGHLVPHRDLEAERQLKTMIQKIQSHMYEPENNTIIRSMLEEAAKFVKASDRVLDLEEKTLYQSYNWCEKLLTLNTHQMICRWIILWISTENFFH